MAILKTLLTWILEWALGLFQKYWAERQQKKKEEKQVDDIIEKIKSPDLEEKLDGIEDINDRVNSNT